MRHHPLFRSVWWISNVLLTLALSATIFSGVQEFSLRRYLKGFSDAVVAEQASPQQKAEEILAWMRSGPPRQESPHLSQLSMRDPQNTLNYRQLLSVCGTATNAFLNLSRSAGLEARRLLLLTADQQAKHVVAEVLVDGRWVIVDPTYRTFLRDAQGNLLTRKDLQDPQIFQEATHVLPGYHPEYTYDHYAHVRLAALPLPLARIRIWLENVFPAWDEYFDWSLLLERRSFLYLFVSASFLIALLLLRMVLGWFADRRLHIPRFHLRNSLSRATTVFFTTPGIK